jgi:F420-non-reducing hydrogenase small subunit
MSGNGTNGRPQVGFYWCAGCGGCEEAVLDLHEKVLDVVAAVDIVFWPVALDFKRADMEARPDGSLLAVFINGGIRNDEQLEMARMLRRKAKVVIAFGACAQLGGIPGLANQWEWPSVLQAAYFDAPSLVDRVTPSAASSDEGHEMELPHFLPRLRPLDTFIDVDYYVPGCPPTANIIESALNALLSGEVPPKGAVLAPARALCNDCPRKDSKPEDMSIAAFKRPSEIIADPEKCLLAQGLMCLGPATRSGCDSRCVRGNMPCTGCFGPTPEVRDFGAKALTGIMSLIASKDAAEIERALDGVPDPVGLFYRYSLPASLLERAGEVRRG